MVAKKRMFGKRFKKKKLGKTKVKKVTKPKKKLICFDMDGTLVYSDKPHVLAYQETFKRNGLEKVSKRRLISNFGVPGEMFIKEIFPNLNIKKIKKVVKEHDDLVVKKTFKYVKKIRGVRDVLVKLKKEYEIGVLSNCKHKEIIALLKGAGIDKRLFDVVVGNDDVKHGKPWPDEVLKAEKILKLDAEYLVGDTVYDIKAGKKAKTKVISVLTGTTNNKKDLEKEKPYKILRSIRSLPRFLGVK